MSCTSWSSFAVGAFPVEPTLSSEIGLLSKLSHLSKEVQQSLKQVEMHYWQLYSSLKRNCFRPIKTPDLLKLRALVSIILNMQFAKPAVTMIYARIWTY